ncbi:unnamed protein product [Microthlaspi erraticum]|uniref:F-box domain-containing protein n=1 Tax=Microthlaspi erraticum TaxID=1685480 RepID=A0A6D2KYY0_9BRAS|nr:unnamed protein product [Microthlaspi erraticum]CAA7058534.1 unnamed protein product [Microthlaspi erraticum]
MKKLKCSRCSELPTDLLRRVLGRLSVVEHHRARKVCRNWYLYSKQTMLGKSESPPWLMLFPFPEDGCVLYNPTEKRVCGTKREFSGIRFLANSGNWFLVLDSRSNLYIIDLFSDKRINLPSLKSVRGGAIRDMRIRGKEVKEAFENLRGVLWVDENNEEFVVVWCFDTGLAFCKNGQDYFGVI